MQSTAVASPDEGRSHGSISYRGDPCFSQLNHMIEVSDSVEFPACLCVTVFPMLSAFSDSLQDNNVSRVLRNHADHHINVIKYKQ